VQRARDARFKNKPTAFVDTSVIAAFLRRDPAAVRMFDLAGQVSFVVDPVVLQEALTLPQVQASPKLLDRLRERLDFKVLPLDVERGQAILERARQLRNAIAHSSDALIVGSASQCDYLVTYDRDLRGLIEGDRPLIVTPEELATEIGSN
jgi:predicted nucleic acid-binding protein